MTLDQLAEELSLLTHDPDMNSRHQDADQLLLEYINDNAVTILYHNLGM
jgi:hypothetical protein